MISASISMFHCLMCVCEYLHVTVCVGTRHYNYVVQNVVYLLFRNATLNWALLFETALAIFFLYCPGMDKGLRIYPLRFVLF